METTPEYHVITGSRGLRPLEARRVNAVSFKVARGPLRAISRLDSVRSDVFFSCSSNQRGSCNCRKNISLSRPLSLYLAFPAFSPCATIYVERSHRALLSLGEIECVISLGITSVLCGSPPKKKWKLLEYGERCSKMTTMLAGQEIALE